MLVCRLQRRGLAAVMVLAVVGLVVAVGCAPAGYSGPTGTVSGKVTVDGKPAPEGCVVTFIGEGGGQVASGKTGAGGAYQLSAAGKPQVPAVKYKVSVTPPPQGEMSQADYDKMMAEGGAKPEAKAPESPIPDKYHNPGTSELSFEVKAGANTIDIELK